MTERPKETRAERRARKLREQGITRFWPVPMVPLQRATKEGTVTAFDAEDRVVMVRGSLRRAT